MWKLYWQCLQRAFPGAWSATWISSAVGTIGGGVVALAVEMPSMVMNILIAAIPFVIFAALMIGGPLIAALRMCQELQCKIQERENWFDEQIKGLQSQVQQAHALMDRRQQNQAVRQQLGILLHEGQQLSEQCRSADGETLKVIQEQATAWATRAEEFLYKNLGTEFVPRFRNDPGLPAVTLTGSGKRDDLWNWIRMRLANLERFMTGMAPV